MGEPGRTHYLGREQCSGLGTVCRTLLYPYDGGPRGYLPYRLDHVVEPGA